MKRITQMLTGHSTLQRHLYLMKMEDSPICQNCLEDEETVEHFLTEANGLKFGMTRMSAEQNHLRVEDGIALSVGAIGVQGTYPPLPPTWDHRHIEMLGSTKANLHSKLPHSLAAFTLYP